MNEEILQRTNKKIIENEQKQKHTFELFQRQYDVHQRVFSPCIFLGTKWLTQALLLHFEKKQMKSFCEIGVGCGCIMIEVLRKFPELMAVGVDINDYAVKNTIENLHKFQTKAIVLKSDVLEAVNDKKFDAIFWNYPFHPTDKNFQDLGDIQKGVRDPNYRGLRKLLFSVEKYLSPNGQILLGFSLTMADMGLVKKIGEEYGYRIELLDKMTEGGTICLIQLRK